MDTQPPLVRVDPGEAAQEREETEATELGRLVGLQDPRGDVGRSRRVAPLELADLAVLGGIDVGLGRLDGLDLAEALRVDEALVDAVAGQELVVRAGLADLAVGQDDDLVGVADCGESI